MSSNHPDVRLVVITHSLTRDQPVRDGSLCFFSFFFYSLGACSADADASIPFQVDPPSEFAERKTKANGLLFVIKETNR